MKCGSAQISSVWDQPEKTLVKAQSCIRTASSAGASIICFPEQFTAGWDPLSHTNIESLTGTTITTLQKFAREYSIAIIGSFREEYVPSPRNTAVAIGADGEIHALYAKMHLFTPAHEEQAFTAGDMIATFSVDGVKCGLAICYDLRFPSLFRIYAKEGVQAVFVPSAWPASRIRHWELFIAARAAENQMYVLGCTTTGTNPVDEYCGASMTADPHGTIVARAGNGEELLYSEIDPVLVDTVRREFPVGHDQKDALYQSLLNRNR
ncbi:MAG: nitrilase-related carbon-nitrogen hydrolase [Methanoregula sp.]